MMNWDDKYRLSKDVEREFEYRKWAGEIPEIHLPSGWSFVPMPPFSGAVCRFAIIAKGVRFSVYLDCYDILGCYGEPYWEVYQIDGDVFRCDMDKPEEFIKAIKTQIAN